MQEQEKARNKKNTISNSINFNKEPKSNDIKDSSGRDETNLSEDDLAKVTGGTFQRQNVSDPGITQIA